MAGLPEAHNMNSSYSMKFDGKDTMEQHKPIRDQVAALERASADFLRQLGYEILGSHPKPALPDERLFAQVRNIIVSKFPPLEQVRHDCAANRYENT